MSSYTTTLMMVMGQLMVSYSNVMLARSVSKIDQTGGGAMP